MEELFLQGRVFAPSNLWEESGIDKENPEEDAELQGKARPEHRQEGGRTAEAELGRCVGARAEESSQGDAGHDRSARRGPKLGGPRPRPSGALTSMG